MTVREDYPKMERPERFDPNRYQADEIKVFSALVGEPVNVSGYLRTGGCTAGCGACCEAMVVPLDADARGALISRGEHISAGRLQLPIDRATEERAGFEDWERWLALHDTSLLAANDVLQADTPIKADEPPPEAAAEDFDAWVAWLESLGVTLIRYKGDQTLLAYLRVACTALENGLCSLVGTPERPHLCGDSPRHPRDVAGIDFCTYNFQPISPVQVGMELAADRAQQAKMRKGKRGRKRR